MTTDDVDQLGRQVDNLTRAVRDLRRQLSESERAAVQLANDILDQAPDCWDGDESCDYIAVQYVRALEDLARWTVGRMPLRGDNPRTLVCAPEWANRAAREPDEDRGIDGDPDIEVRYGPDGRGWHIGRVA